MPNAHDGMRIPAMPVTAMTKKFVMPALKFPLQKPSLIPQLRQRLIQEFRPAQARSKRGKFAQNVLARLCVVT